MAMDEESRLRAELKTTNDQFEAVKKQHHKREVNRAHGSIRWGFILLAIGGGWGFSRMQTGYRGTLSPYLHETESRSCLWPERA
jgi:hypothetical protein